MSFFKEVVCNGAPFVVPEHVNFRCPGGDVTRSLPSENPWSVIHYRLANAMKWNAENERAYYENVWLNLIPRCGTCREEWAALTAEQPIDWTSQESAAFSLWDLHRKVNERIGRYQISYEQSRELWSGPRVAFLAGNYGHHGGSESFARTLLKHLRHRRNVVGFGAVLGGGDPEQLQVPYFEGPQAIQELCKRADVIVTWGTNQLLNLIDSRLSLRESSASFGNESRYFRGAKGDKKIIAVHHGDLESGWFRETILDERIDEFVCVNSAVAEHLKTIRSCPVHYIPNAVDPLRLQTTRNLELIRSLIPVGTKVVLFGHRMAEEKRPQLAIEIAKLLPADWMMVMAGDGPERPKDFPSNVRFVGHVNTLADWLAVSSCFISLSTFEGFGLSMAEAHAAGVPIVATPAGIGQEVASFVLPVYSDPQHWVEAITNVDRFEKPCKDYSLETHVRAWSEVLM